ncbi:MAG: response regulator transcription factor [Flavobacteriia bacterium]|nr:response regulator transcription factor [Flavobacteriia bacterium]
MIKVVIIDDEQHAIEFLEYQLKKIDDVEILGTLQDSTKAVDFIEKLSPDIVFLDIEMPIINGFEILQQFKKPTFKVIFTTAYQQYALRALKIHALDYLLKPIEKEELQLALNEFINDQLFTSDEQVSRLGKFKMGQMAETLALSGAKTIDFIQVDKIMYFEAAGGSYTSVVLDNEEVFLVSKGIGNFEDILADNPLFFRAYKSYIINLTFVKKYLRETDELIMKNNKSLILSRAKKQEFLNLFKKI